MSDIRTITISEATKFLRFHFKQKQPVFIWGPPGIGKSDMVQQIADSLPNCLLIDVRLPLWEPTDIKGIPFFSQESKTMEWARPSELPSEEEAAKYTHVILFLDELNGAAPSVQAAAYQLILNRKVGPYKLPDNVIIVAAGNRDSDKGVTYRMPKPLANRFLHYEIAVNFNDWNDWAINNGQHPDVVGYLTVKKNHLHNYEPTSNERSFATPRSWSFVSKLLYDAADFSPSEVTDMVSAAVGQGVALSFSAHRKISNLLPDPRHILSGQIKTLKITEVSAVYSLAVSLAYELKIAYEESKRDTNPDDFNEIRENFVAFVSNNFQPEMAVMCMKMVSNNYQIPMRLTALASGQSFLTKYSDMFTRLSLND